MPDAPELTHARPRRLLWVDLRVAAGETFDGATAKPITLGVPVVFMRDDDGLWRNAHAVVTPTIDFTPEWPTGVHVFLHSSPNGGAAAHGPAKREIGSCACGDQNTWTTFTVPAGRLDASDALMACL